MKFFKSEGGAIVLWVMASLVGAAILTPYLYDAGKAFAESAKTADYPRIIESVAGSAERAKSDRYFSRCLLLSAILLLPVLIRRVRSISPNPFCEKSSLRRLNFSQSLLHLSSGILVGAMSLGILATVLNLSGISYFEEESTPLKKLFTKAFLPAVGAGVIEEIIFRGLLLGLWLRACSLWNAWVGRSLVFAVMHFLKPPDGLEIPNPGAWYCGFEILLATLYHFISPLFFLTEFLTLVLFGFLLAYCRTKTFSLWLPIGLHVGYVFALKAFSITQDVDSGSRWIPWLIGTDLKTGILPLITLGFSFLACVHLVKKISPSPR